MTTYNPAEEGIKAAKKDALLSELGVTPELLHHYSYLNISESNLIENFDDYEIARFKCGLYYDPLDDEKDGGEILVYKNGDFFTVCCADDIVSKDFLTVHNFLIKYWVGE